MNKLTPKSNRTRNHIIENSADIFNKKGYAGTSMSDIMYATGLSKGCIYGNFHNKEEVASSAFKYNLSKISRMVSEQMCLAESAVDRLMVYVNIYDRYNMPPFPQGGCPIMNTAIESDDTNIFLKGKAAQAVRKWENGITEIILTGIEKGEFRNDIDPAEFASSMIAMIEGGMMLSKVTGEKMPLDRVKKTITRMIGLIGA